MRLKANDLYWVTREGDPIPIPRMETSHLRNTVAMLERTGRTDHPSFPALKQELERRNNAQTN